MGTHNVGKRKCPEQWKALANLQNVASVLLNNGVPSNRKLGEPEYAER